MTDVKREAGLVKSVTVITTWIIATGSEQKMSAEFNSCLLGPQRLKHFAISYCGTNDPSSLDICRHTGRADSRSGGEQWPRTRRSCLGRTLPQRPTVRLADPHRDLTAPFTASWQSASKCEETILDSSSSLDRQFILRLGPNLQHCSIASVPPLAA